MNEMTQMDTLSEEHAEQVQAAGSSSSNAGRRLLKRMQEDEWHRQWAERNHARYIKEQRELAMVARAGGL